MRSCENLNALNKRLSAAVLLLYKKLLASGKWDLQYVNKNTYGEPMLHQIVTALGLSDDTDTETCGVSPDEVSHALTLTTATNYGQFWKEQLISSSENSLCGNESPTTSLSPSQLNFNREEDSVQSINENAWCASGYDTTPFACDCEAFESDLEADMWAAYELQNVKDSPFNWLHQSC